MTGSLNFAPRREEGAVAAEEPATFSIGDLSREFGISLRTLRFYEDRGLITPQRRGTSRIYGGQDRARLEVILKGKELGFTLTEIRALLAAERPGEGAAPTLPLSLAQIDSQIEHLEGELADIQRALAELKARRAQLQSS